MKLAVINAADTGAVEATAFMLSKVGYDCYLPHNALRQELRHIGVTSDDPMDLAKRFAYDHPRVPYYYGGVEAIDLFVDLKAHAVYGKLAQRWPSLTNKVLWLCINGGTPLKRPEREWSDPPCPVLTHNQWYECETFGDLHKYESSVKGGGASLKLPWFDRSYTCFPPYQRLERHQRLGHDGQAVCLVHNVERWGYGEAVEKLKGHVLFFGGGSPAGLISNDQCCDLLKRAVAMVLVKCGDAVGFSTVEAMSSACPVVCTQHYIDETRLHRLLEPGVTCLTFDQKYPVESLKAALDVLSCKVNNERIGQAGRERLVELMWREDRDLPSFQEFMEGHYGR